MKTSIILGLFCTLSLAAPICARSDQGTSAPSKPALNAYSRGQSYERLFQDHLMPGTCGIVLERARCAEDLRSVQDMRGADSTDSFMNRWIASGDRALFRGDWNGVYVPESTWSSDPVFAWWYTAGIASIATSLPESSGTDEYEASIASVFLKHPNAAPSGFREAISQHETGLEALSSLQSLLQHTIPVDPYPMVSLKQGEAGAAQLGILVSTLQELVDNEFALSRPESRAFGLITLRRLQEMHELYHSNVSLGTIEQAIRGELPIDPGIVNQELRQPLSLSGASRSWPDGPRHAYLLGSFLAQVAYNSAVLKDAAADQNFRNMIGSLPPYDGMPLEARSAIGQLKSAQSGDWTAINAFATAATLAIVSCPSTPIDHNSVASPSCGDAQGH